MSKGAREYFAIGITHSIETIRLLEEQLDPKRFGFGAEGTGMSGYELYVFKDSADVAVQKIRAVLAVHLGQHEVSFYDRPRAIDDGTRYDRLLDHLEGPDPDRPSTDGIRFEA